MQILFLFLLLGISLPVLCQTPTLSTLVQGPEASGSSPAVRAYADEMPAFPGGEVALHRYLLAKTTYPAEAKRRGLSGVVVMQFTVDEQGRVLDPTAVKASSPDFTAEALRLVRLMPWWTPGREQGQPVRVRCTLPIQFTFKR